MATATRKTELSPLEAIVIETTLGEEARQDAREGTLARIQQLTRERQKLYKLAAAHPFLAPAHGPRLHEISVEIEHLWETLRRERAVRRVAIERALHVTSEDDESDHQEQLERQMRQQREDSHDAA